MPGIASSAPAVLIAAIAAATERIRVGSGGVMLPNHAPLAVAEQFGTLAALHPGRIDLGLGRAPGSDQLTAVALRRTDRLGADDFPEQLGELACFLAGDFPADHPFSRITAVPAGELQPPLWLLGSSLFSAELAGMLGLPFAFAHHFSSANTLPALGALPRVLPRGRAADQAVRAGQRAERLRRHRCRGRAARAARRAVVPAPAAGTPGAAAHARAGRRVPVDAARAGVRDAAPRRPGDRQPGDSPAGPRRAARVDRGGRADDHHAGARPGRPDPFAGARPRPVRRTSAGPAAGELAAGPGDRHPVRRRGDRPGHHLDPVHPVRPRRERGGARAGASTPRACRSGAGWSTTPRRSGRTPAPSWAPPWPRPSCRPGDVAAIGITNQRETTVVWDRSSGRTGRPGDRLAGHPHAEPSAPSWASSAAVPTATARAPGCRWRPTSPGPRCAGYSTTSTAPGAAPRRASWPSARSTRGCCGTSPAARTAECTSPTPPTPPAPC